jgi:hypothetical protein
MPDYIDNPHVLAEAWRHSIGLSRARLSKLTGYSVGHIRNMEAGLNHATRQPIPARSFVRYRMACAAIHAGLEFDFRNCVVGSPRRPTKTMA